jgi:hypothetical protein
VALVRQQAERRLERRRTWSRDAVAIAPLVAASWVAALVSWPLTRDAFRWLFTGWHVPTGGFVVALAVYSILGLVLACVSAIAVARRARVIGSIK